MQVIVRRGYSWRPCSMAVVIPRIPQIQRKWALSKSGNIRRNALISPSAFVKKTRQQRRPCTWICQGMVRRSELVFARYLDSADTAVGAAFQLALGINKFNAEGNRFHRR